jgi:DNA (cytosine-5)-methyltransferase 1
MPTFIEVCAGAGGLSTGFMQEGFTPLLLNEILPIACETLKINHPSAPLHTGSMTDLDLTQYVDKVDVLMGGVPCQSFSHAGERKGMDDPRGQLIVSFHGLVRQCRPKVFFIENVKGLTTHAKGETLRNIVALFSGNGYEVSHAVLNAVDYGVPQKRERVFIVGVLSGVFAFPDKLAAPVPTLRSVLHDVPASPGAVYTEAKKKVMELVPPGGCWVDLPKEVKEAYMGNCLHAGGGKRGMARRLSMDEPCLTLTTSPAQKQTDRCHPTEIRPFTVREYARIQSFPDDYVFAGSTAAQYKQIGNAVPVKLAQAMARSVLEVLKLIG